MVRGDINTVYGEHGFQPEVERLIAYVLGMNESIHQLGIPPTSFLTKELTL